MSDEGWWRIERVDRPRAGLFALSVSRPGAREAWLIAVGRPRARPDWAIVAERPRGQAADPEVRALRQRLEGARALERRDAHGRLSIRLSREDQAWLIVDGGRLVVDTIALGMTGELVDDVADARARERGLTFVAEHERALVEDARRVARASVAKARSRLQRRVEAIAGDLAAASDAERTAERVRPFVAAAARARRGATSIEALDYSSGEPVTVTLALSSDRSAREQLDAVFARAKRLRAGATVAEARRGEAAAALSALAEVEARLTTASTHVEVDAALATIERWLSRSARGSRGSIAMPPRALPRGVREYIAASGERILVGRDAASNDALTVRVARPGDLWLHARGVSGSHVVVPRWCAAGGGASETLVDAATLAAHFSDARGDAVVDVAYADRRHVKKAKGAAPGAVTLLAERVLSVRLEPARVARLLG